MKKFFQTFTLITLSFVSVTAAYSYPFYAGVSGGYGSTTWRGLVPSTDKQNDALSISIPIDVQEGGEMWGAQVGYEFTPHFAIEASYKHYPEAVIHFDANSLFALDNDDKVRFVSSTESLSLMAKVMINILDSNARFYSSAGIANLHRKDDVLKQWILTPTFGVGFNYNFNEHFMGELGMNYTAGYGESELSPADTFIPFLYSVLIGFSYRF